MLFNKSEKCLDSFIKRLRSRHKETSQCLFAFLAILFEEYGYTLEEHRRKLDGEVVSLESRTGMGVWYKTTEAFSNISEYEVLMHDLHDCNTYLIIFTNVLNFEIEFGSFCGRLFEVFEELRERNGDGKFHTDKARDGFRQHLAYCMNDSRFRQNQTQSLRMRVQSQLDVVSFSLADTCYSIHPRNHSTDYNQMYSLISQRDSRLNLSIAEDSKRLAEAVQQDSRTMKTIALMTLIFLPGTLLAVSPSAQIL